MSDIVKKETNALALLDFSADAGAGLEGVDSGSTVAIPFLRVLQGLSPQLRTVKGARPGLIINTITNELYEKARVVPCAFQREFLQWAPRSQGGGFRGRHSPSVVETGQLPGLERNANGTYNLGEDMLDDTRNHFVLVETATGWAPALLSMRSTQIKKSKHWLARIKAIELVGPNGRKFTPPSFSHIYTLSTKDEQNSSGSWSGLVIELEGPVTDPDLYAKAKRLHDDFTRGEVSAQEPVGRDDF